MDTPRRHPSLNVGASLLGLCLLGCGDNQDDAGARALLEKVRADRYTTWERAPGYETRRESHAPHSETVDIYVNDIIAEALVVGEAITAWPHGSVIVKEGYDGSALELIAVMEKRSDGWYWAEYDDDGDPDYSGHPDVCLDCHVKGADYVRAFGLPRGAD